MEQISRNTTVRCDVDTDKQPTVEKQTFTNPLHEGLLLFVFHFLAQYKCQHQRQPHEPNTFLSHHVPQKIHSCDPAVEGKQREAEEMEPQLGVFSCFWFFIGEIKIQSRDKLPVVVGGEGVGTDKAGEPVKAAPLASHSKGQGT